MPVVESKMLWKKKASGELSTADDAGALS